MTSFLLPTLLFPSYNLFSEANLCNMSVGRSGVIKIHTTGCGGGGNGLLFSFKKAFLKTSSIRPRFSRIPVCYKTGGEREKWDSSIR